MRIAACFLFGALFVLSIAFAHEFMLYQNPVVGGGDAAVDSHGVVWYQLGSDMKGFDPATEEIVSYKLPTFYSGTVAVDAFDGVWFCYNNPWRLYQGEARVYFLEGSVQELAASPDGPVWVSVRRKEGQGWVWVLMRFEDGSWNEVSDCPSTGLARGICFESDGTGWFVFKQGLARYRDGDWTLFEQDVGQVEDMAARSSGEVWIAGGITGNVSVFQDGEFVRSYGVSDGLGGDWPEYLDVDRLGRVWVGDFLPAGVSMFDGENWTVFNTLNSGLPSNEIGGIAAAADGSVYFTTGGGLARYKNGLWSCYTGAESSVINNDISSVAVNDRGQLFYGTGSGQLGYYDGSRWEVLYQPEITFGDEIRDIEFGPGESIWLACSSNLKVWRGMMIEYPRAGTGGMGLSSCKDICRDISGNMWICCAGGVAKYEGYNTWQSWSVWDESSQTWFLDPCSIASDLEGKVWVGTDKGLAVLQNDTLVDWLPEYPYASAIACDNDGMLWIGFDLSQMGVLEFDGENEVAWHTMDDGLPSNRINCIACDEGGNVWVGTQDGLAYFDRDQWTMWDTDSGLPVNEIRDIAIAPNGDVWFATPNGLLCHESGIEVPKPTIAIATDSDEYQAGDTMTVTLTYANPGPDINIDIQIACMLPDGSLFYYPGGDLPAPFMSGMLPSGTTVPTVLVLSYEFPEGFPTGQYTWLAVICEQGTFNFLSDISSASFTLQ